MGCILAGAQSNEKEIIDMDYIRTDANGQLVFEQSTEFLHIPCCLYGFHNTETLVGKAASGRTVYCFQGKLDLPEKERRCKCGKRMHLFKTEDIVRKGGHEARYDELLLENKLLFTVDLIKEKLADAYRMTDETKMADRIIDIMIRIVSVSWMVSVVVSLQVLPLRL